jgi:ElaB/YqjD/DUF883 family membrane-anchored ribosome-binding protein
MSSNAEASVDKLVADLQLLVSDAEAILQATAADAGEKASAARTRIRDTLREARAQIERVEEKVVFEAKMVAHETDRFVHDRPWQAMGIAAAVGLVIGVLIGRK